MRVCLRSVELLFTDWGGGAVTGGGDGEYRGGDRLGRSGQRDAGRQDEAERLQCDDDDTFVWGKQRCSPQW